MKHKISLYVRMIPVSLYWLVGFILGILICFCIDILHSPTVDGEFFTPLSISGIVLTSFFPIVLTILLGHFKCCIFLRVTLVLNGLIHGFCLLLLCMNFRYGGWFVSFFSMFSQSCISALIVFLSSLMCNHKFCFHKSLYFLFVISAVLICLVDYFCVAKLFV